MAIWQVPIYLIKKSGILNCSDKQFLKSLDTIREIFPEEKSWCKSIKQFGSIDSTCLEIIYDDLEEDEIRLRLDLRNITKEHLKILLKFINKNEFKLHYEDEVYEATMTNFKEIIENSIAYKFVCNPKGFFDDLNV